MKREFRNDHRREGLLRRGFTLIEVLLVLIILGAIAALVVPRLFGSQEQAMIDQTKVRIHQVEAAVELYKIQHGAQYPESLDDLVHPLDRHGQPMDPYEDDYPVDAWGNPLNYVLDQDEAGRLRPFIWSNGPNGVDDNGSGDDITNWSD